MESLVGAGRERKTKEKEGTLPLMEEKHRCSIYGGEEDRQEADTPIHNIPSDSTFIRKPRRALLRYRSFLSVVSSFRGPRRKLI